VKKSKIWAVRFAGSWMWFVQTRDAHGPVTFATFEACVIFLRLISGSPARVSNVGRMRVPFSLQVVS
jgi:hypothetical protein